MSTGVSLSGLELLMWNLEADPTFSSAFANLTLLDGPPDLTRLRRRMAYASSQIPRFRLRVVGRGSQVRWAECPDFDIAQHVRVEQLPKPGTEAALRQFAVDLLARPFDTTRPLWDFVIVEGLRDGGAAIIQKLHHIVADGEGGLRLAELFVDLSADAATPRPRGMERAELENPNPLARLMAATTESARRQTQRSLHWITHPLALPRVGIETAEAASGLLGQFVAGTAVRAPLWGGRGGPVALETMAFSLDQVREASARRGCTINDLFVTAAVQAAAKIYDDAGIRRRRIRLAMPVSTRGTGVPTSANAFSLSRVAVEVIRQDSDRALQVVHDQLGVAKTAGVDLIGAAAPAVATLPPWALIRLMRTQAAGMDMVVSNVRGAPVDLYIGGAKMVANYPMGPLSGMPVNLTMLSHAGQVQLGLMCDTAAVNNPVALRDALSEAFAELLS